MPKKTVKKTTAAVAETNNNVQEVSVMSATATVEAAAKRAMVPATKAYELSAEQIAAAIEAGDIANVGSTDVTIKVDASKTGKDEVLPYEKLVALTLDGMVLLAGGKVEPATEAPTEGKDERTDAQKQKGACDHFNYGLDLDVKRYLRRILSNEIEGPAKIIAQTAQKLVDAGLFDSLDEAVADVKAKRAAKGLPV